jgi:hypothetical protein
MQPTSKLRRAVVAAATAMLMTATAGCGPLARNADEVVRHGDDAGRAINRGRSQRELPQVDLGKAKDIPGTACELYKTTNDSEQDCP